MPDLDEVMGLIELLDSEEDSFREQAQREILAMGAEAIPYLNRARGQPRRYSYVEVFRMLAKIGDDLFAEGGVEKIGKSILDTMEYGAKNRLKSMPEEAREISMQALTRWGMEVPEPRKRKIRYCHRCNRPSSVVTVRGCFLYECSNSVCEEHASIIEGGYIGTWFCTDEHRKYALDHPSILMVALSEKLQRKRVNPHIRQVLVWSRAKRRLVDRVCPSKTAFFAQSIDSFW